MTFGMAPWHLSEHVDKQKSKEALQSQSPHRRIQGLQRHTVDWHCLQQDCIAQW